jgi:hypothetical protein
MRFPRTLAIAGLTVAALLPVEIRAQDAASIDPTPFLGKDWYGVYLQGQKMGCAEVTMSREKRGDTPTVVHEMRITMKIQGMGEKAEVRIEQRDVFAATGPQELLESHSLQSQGAGTLERAGAREKDGFVIRTLQGKEETERETVPLPRESLSDALCGEALALAGAKAGTKRKAFSFEALAKDTHYSADLFTKGLLRPSRKLGPPGKVQALTLRIRGADPALKLPSDGRQTVKREDDGALLLVLAAEVAREGLPAATDPDCRDALRSTAEYACTNPEIQALARKAVGDASTPEEKVRRLVRFVEDYVADALCITSVSALDVLRDRKGDCTEHAMLFIALCRALGVPAREVGGLMYAGDELGAFGGHMWAEVALDGRWVSADPTWGEFPVDATHIKEGEGGKAENTLRMLTGAMRVEVVSVETAK